MLKKEIYELMKDKYGFVGSWAVWHSAGRTPKSNIDNMDWMYSDNLLDILNTGYIFVGLNWSGTHGDVSKGGTVSWANFHSGYSRGNDYKLRYAFEGTRFWGSYITDIIKFYEEVDSTKVKSYLNKNPEFVKQNVEDFEKEISYLGNDLKLIALGGDTYNILKKYLGNKYEIKQIKHFSFTIGKEKYREEALEILRDF